jgi:hypothetical protein
MGSKGYDAQKASFQVEFVSFSRIAHRNYDWEMDQRVAPGRTHSLGVSSRGDSTRSRARRILAAQLRPHAGNGLMASPKARSI